MEVLLDTCGRRRVKTLLLIYLFVLKAAADCPRPQGRGNIVLSNEALLMNDFPEASDVTLECGNGYVQESGSGIITCIDGNWTEPDLTCKKKDCGPPKSEPNMSFNISAGTLFGDTIKVICDEGYRVSGSNYKQCYASGWSARRTKCEIIKCEKPGEVTNGRSSWGSQDDPKYGEIIQYVCNEGYTLIGKDSIVCSEAGEYDSQPPECKEASTSTDSSATPTAHRDKSITTSATPTVSPSARGVTTEDRITTKMVAPTSTPPAQEASTSTDSFATPTAHREKSITTSATPTVSPSARGGTDISTAEDKATTTSVTSMTSSSFQDKHDGAVDTNKDVGYIPVIVSVICVALAVCIVLFVYKFLLKRKGSYDTREDLKPELLQFQNL